MLERFHHKFQVCLTVLGPYKIVAIALLFVMLFAALFEAIGLSLVIPFIGIILGHETAGSESKAISNFNQLFSEYVSAEMRVLGICVVILAIFVIKNLFVYVRSVMTVYFQNSLRKYWSARILDKYIHAEYDYIISKKRGALINNLINEPMIASKFMGKLTNYFSKMFVALAIYLMLLIVNWQFTLFLSIVIVLVLAFFWKMSRKVADVVGKKRLALLQKITAEGEESLNAIRQVKLFSIENKILKEFSGKFHVLKKLLVKLGVYKSIPVPFGEILIIFGFVSVLIYFEYIGDISIADMLPMMAFAIVTSQKLYENVSALVTDRMWFLAYVPAVEVVSNILTGKEIKKEELTDGIKIGQLQDDIVFENVSFSYDNRKMILKNLNLRIPRNKIAVVTGKSGSGKSTLVDLLCGLYKGYEGKIKIGNIELSELDLSNWRGMIGFVSQDTFLFNSSVRENIALGKQNCGEEDVVRAAELANASEFIERLSEGYDTVLGDRGLKVSGGQRQRITIARALVRKPQLLIFDEATSSLDTESERLIQESIEGLRDTKTIIIISHRLATIKNADLIYVLNNGSLIESGTYDELLNKQGFFCSIALQQA